MEGLVIVDSDGVGRLGKVDVGGDARSEVGAQSFGLLPEVVH